MNPILYPLAGFVLSSFRMALFRLFAWRFFVFSFFRMAFFRLFVILRGVFIVFSPRKDEMAQTGHHTYRWTKYVTIGLLQRYIALKI